MSKATIFLSYAHEDESDRKTLEKHLASLKREGWVEAWYDRLIEAGEDWDSEIHSKLDQSHIILLLVSPDFMASSYCNQVEVTRAMQRHKMGTARVIPVLVRPTDWEGAPFSKLQSLPTDASPVSQWDDRDAAFLDIVQHVRDVCRTVAATPGNPANPYVAASIGDWVEVQLMVDMHKTGETRLGSVRMTLVRKTDREASLRMDYESDDIDLHDAKIVKIRLDQPVQDSLQQMVRGLTSQEIPAGALIEARQTGAGAEKLFIGGKPYYTTWIASEVEARLGREREITQAKVWLTSEVPLDGVIKYSAESPDMTVTNVVTDYGRAGKGSRRRKPRPLKAPQSQTRTAPSPPPPPPPPPRITLAQVILGGWNMQIQRTMAPPISAQFYFDPSGGFTAQFMDPMTGNASSVQGQWSAQGGTLFVQGVQTVGFMTMPYSAVLNIANLSPNRLDGLTTAGEMVTFFR
jgi:hypothetical protein